MKALKLFTLLAASALFAACGNNANNNNAEAEAAAAHDCTTCQTPCGNNIEGRWIQPVPGMEGQVQGIELKKDGIAQSINMSTLVFEKWSKDSTTLTLTGKSIGNGQTIDITETYTIAQGDPNTLNLIKDGTIAWSFSKEGASACGDGCKEGGCGHDHAKEKAAGQPKEKGCTGCGGCGK